MIKKRIYWLIILLRGEPGLSGGRQYGKGFAWIPVWVDYRERSCLIYFWRAAMRPKLCIGDIEEILFVFDVVIKQIVLPSNFNVKWVCIQMLRLMQWVCLQMLCLKFIELFKIITLV